MRTTDPSFRPSVRLTPLGRTLLMLALLAGTLGWMLNENRLLLLAAILFAAPLVSRLCARRSLRGIDVTLEAPAEAFAHERFEARVSIRKAKGSRPAFGVRLDVAEFRPASLAFLPAILPGERACLDARRAIARRGWTTIPGVTLRTRFPLVLAEATLAAPSPATILVLPAPVPVPRRCLNALKSAAPDPAISPVLSPSSREPEELHALVAWRAGMPARRIHARASARHDQPIARDLRGAPGGEVLVAFDAAPAASPDERFFRRFEKAAGMATSLLLRFSRDGTPHRLLAGARVRASGRSALRALAVLEPEQDGTPRLDWESSTLVWISPAGRPAPAASRPGRVIELFRAERVPRTAP